MKTVSSTAATARRGSCLVLCYLQESRESHISLSETFARLHLQSIRRSRLSPVCSPCARTPLFSVTSGLRTHNQHQTLMRNGLFGINAVHGAAQRVEPRCSGCALGTVSKKFEEKRQPYPLVSCGITLVNRSRTSVCLSVKQDRQELLMHPLTPADPSSGAHRSINHDDFVFQPLVGTTVYHFRKNHSEQPA